MERFGRSFSSSSTSSLMGGGLISWAPRIYTCSFCKREFKSAQAFGGHMNVHRRDRARLRQSPPWDPPICHPNLNPNPNLNPKPNSNPVPNLNFSPPPDTTTEVAKPTPVTYTFPSLLSPCTRFTAVTANVASTVTASPAPVHLRRDELKSTRTVKALFGVRKLDRFMEEDDEAVGGDLEGGLDLELRLGYT